MVLSKEEIRRKLLHLFALIMPIGLFYFPMWKPYPYWLSVALLAFFAVGSTIVELLRFRIPALQKIFLTCFGHMMRKEEKSAKVTGSTYVVWAALICSLIFWDEFWRHISFMVLTMFILGDAVAALVGISMGRIKIGKKSLEGSLACFALCMILFCILFPHLPHLKFYCMVMGNNMLWIGLAASLTITVFELVPLKITSKLTINDNLAVPVIAGAVIWIMEKTMVINMIEFVP